jgi:hypothetical protein
VQQLAERYFGGWAAAPGAVTLDSSIQQLAAEPLPQPAAVAAAASGATAAIGAVASIGATAAAAAATARQQLSSAVGSIGAKQLGSSGVVWDRTGSSSSREFRQRTAAGPLLAMGYYRPSVTGRRGTAMEVGGLPAFRMVCVSRMCRMLKVRPVGMYQPCRPQLHMYPERAHNLSAWLCQLPLCCAVVICHHRLPLMF